MRKLSWLFAAAVAGATGGCDRAPAFPQPPASEYTAARFELSANSKADTVQGATVTQEFLRVSGVRAILGRLFIPGDFAPAGPQTAILSQTLWQRRFGGDPTIIGKPIRLNGQDAIVIGITPREFAIPPGAELWIARR